jgi:integrase/recombinase XerD
MNKTTLHESIENFISYTMMKGYKVKIYRRHLRQFEDYCATHGITMEVVTADVLSKWCYYREESEQTKRTRMNMMIKYAKYLKIQCININIPHHRNHYGFPTHHEPYIFTTDELKRFFSAVDNWELSVYANHTHRTIADPLLFRMYYGCGLRRNEPLHLLISDVDFEKGILHIRNAKNGRSRTVPMSDSLKIKCNEYLQHRFGGHIQDNHYLFHESNPEKPSYDNAIYWRFRQYLEKAGIPRGERAPRIHDFRHTMCVHKMKAWVMKGGNLPELLPYLSKYLGHVDFRGTEYYLRLTSDLYPELIDRMQTFQKDIIPKRQVTVQDGE